MTTLLISTLEENSGNISTHLPSRSGEYCASHLYLSLFLSPERFILTFSCCMILILIDFTGILPGNSHMLNPF